MKKSFRIWRVRRKGYRSLGERRMGRNKRNHVPLRKDFENLFLGPFLPPSIHKPRQGTCYKWMNLRAREVTLYLCLSASLPCPLTRISKHEKGSCDLPLNLPTFGLKGVTPGLAGGVGLRADTSLLLRSEALANFISSWKVRSKEGSNKEWKSSLSYKVLDFEMLESAGVVREI